jgi:UDP-N-acetylglucosamine 4-epimerase
MKFLVTGGAGFIGSNIVEQLLKDGQDVVVLDNFSSGKEENLAFFKNYTQTATRYTLIKGDICDKSTCNRACKGIDVVLHQAALRSVPKSMSKPHEFNAVNIDGTLNMLEAARDNKVKRFVFASSSLDYS